MSRTSAAARGLVPLTAAALLWGTTGVVAQQLQASTRLDAVDVAFLRLAIAAAVLLPVVGGRALRALRADPLALLLVGLGLGAYQVLYLQAVVWAGVGVATVVSLGLAPVLTAAWELTRARRRPTATGALTLLAGLAGLVLVGAAPTAQAPRPLLGLLTAVASGVGYAATTVLSRHVAQRVAPVPLSALSTAVGTVALLPLALAGGLPVPADPAALLGLAHLGVGTMAVAYALYYAGLRTTSGSAAALVTLLEPLTAALLAAAVLGEQLTVGATVGAVLLLGGVAVLYVRPGAL